MFDTKVKGKNCRAGTITDLINSDFFESHMLHHANILLELLVEGSKKSDDVDDIISNQDTFNIVYSSMSSGYLLALEDMQNKKIGTLNLSDLDVDVSEDSNGKARSN